MTRSLYLPLCVLAGCYRGAPPHPVSIALPMLSDEAPINVRSQSRIVIENHKKQERTCPGNVTDQNDPKCLVREYEVAEPVTHVETTATYGAEAINYAQFRVLTDPHYHDKVARLDQLRVRCGRGDIPRWTGTTLMLGGLVTALVGSAKGVPDTVSYAGWAAVGAGLTSYTIGYFGFAGRDCNRAWEIFNEVDLRAESTWMKVDGAGRADEMAALAKQFNDLHRVQGDAAALGEPSPADVAPGVAPGSAGPIAPDAPR